jgi:hypothetical protein
MRLAFTPRPWRVALAAGSLALIGAISPVSAVSLSGTRITPPFPAELAYPGFTGYTQVNLTTLGTLDWIRLGEAPSGGGTSSQTGFNEKAGANLISGYLQSGGAPAADNGAYHFASFSDGTTPVSSGSNGNQVRNVGSFTFDVLASSSDVRRLDVFVASLGNVTGTFTANLLNGSNGLIDTYTNILTGETPAVYQIDFQGNSAADHLSVTFTKTSGPAIGDQISMSAATVSLVPEPASLCLLGLASGAVMLRRQRKA